MQIPFHRANLGPEEEQAVIEVLRSGWITTGKQCEAFEQEFANYKQASTAVAVNSGTAAMFLLLKTLNLQPGDEVITTPITFAATANVIVQQGAKVVLADIDPDTLNISAASVEKCITHKTRALMVVHVAGHPCEMNALKALTEHYGIALIEDCAHAIEATYQGKHTGTFGLGGAFSFYANKNLTTAEGGMIICQDDAFRPQLIALRNHGFNIEPIHRQKHNGFKQYDILTAGYKMNMNDLSAAIGRVQLQKLPQLYQKRLQIVQKYLDFFKDFEGLVPVMPLENTQSAWHLMIVKITDDTPRENWLKYLMEKGVQPSIHFKPIYEFSFYKAYGLLPENCPNAENVKSKIFTLPLYPDLKNNELEYIFETLRNFNIKPNNKRYDF